MFLEDSNSSSLIGFVIYLIYSYFYIVTYFHIFCIEKCGVAITNTFYYLWKTEKQDRREREEKRLIGLFCYYDIMTIVITIVEV